jgi:hypothetical protein
MAQYRVTALSWIGGRTVQPGEIIEYAGTPGSKFEPVDDEAKAAKEAAERQRAVPFRDRPTYTPAKAAIEKPRLVDIPANWRELRPEQRINLARQLGSPVKGTNTERADQVIHDELARRATV